MKRDDYEETTEYGFIKNYRSLRHKEYPKFRKSRLKGIYENNIKRRLKFTEQNTAHLANNINAAIDNPTNSPEHADRANQH